MERGVDCILAACGGKRVGGTSFYIGVIREGKRGEREQLKC